MLTNTKQASGAAIVILGAGGFLGMAAIDAAIDAGLSPVGIVRRPEAAARIERRGATAILGDAASPSSWISRVAGAVAVLDLVQPGIPRRLGARALERIVAERATATRAIVSALQIIPADRRPLYLNVSGVAELVADARGVVTHASTLTATPAGFAKIGLAVRKVVRASGVDAAHVHLGTVYGPGKSFTERILPALEKGRYPIFGRGENRLSLVHVSDAASALVHIATLPCDEAVRAPWIVVDASALTLGEFLTQTAAAIGGPRPRHMPRWVGRAILGSGLMAELTKDRMSDSNRLIASGFAFRYPRFEEGLTATLAALDRAPGVTVNRRTPPTLNATVRT